MEKERYQSVHLHEEEGKRPYAQYGKIGKEYYYKPDDEEGKQRAIRKANAQGPNIECFLRNYWLTKDDQLNKRRKYEQV